MTGVEISTKNQLKVQTSIGPTTNRSHQKEETKTKEKSREYSRIVMSTDCRYGKNSFKFIRKAPRAPRNQVATISCSSCAIKNNMFICIFKTIILFGFCFLFVSFPISLDLSASSFKKMAIQILPYLWQMAFPIQTIRKIPQTQTHTLTVSAAKRCIKTHSFSSVAHLCIISNHYIIDSIVSPIVWMHSKF